MPPLLRCVATDGGGMTDQCAIAAAATVRAALAALAEDAEELARETDAIGAACGWETPAVQEFRELLASLAGGLRRWSADAWDLRRDLRGMAGVPTPVGFAPPGFAPTG